MRGAIPLFPQYAFMARCLLKAQRQIYFYLYLLYKFYQSVVRKLARDPLMFVRKNE